MKKILILILTFLCICTSTQAITIQREEYGTVLGYVLDSDAQPIQNATVTITYHDESKTTTTNNEGFYAISMIPICRCLKNLSVEKEGYRSTCVWVKVMGITWVNITLEQKGISLNGCYINKKEVK